MRVVINGEEVDPNILTADYIENADIETLEFIPDGLPLPDHIEEELRQYHIVRILQVHEALSKAYVQTHNEFLAQRQGLDKRAQWLNERQERVLKLFGDFYRGMILLTLLVIFLLSTVSYFVLGK